MKPDSGQSTRRKFLQQTAAVAIVGAVPVVAKGHIQAANGGDPGEEMRAGRMPFETQGKPALQGAAKTQVQNANLGHPGTTAVEKASRPTNRDVSYRVGTQTSRAAVRSAKDLARYQDQRRRELWGLLGDLPWGHKPGPAKVVSKEEHEDYTLERLVLDLNGFEPVPALLLIPKKRQTPAPGLLYIHWHGGMYDLGKEMLLKGVEVAPAYAPVCAEKGLVTLAIDSWCFGERKREKNGHQGEENAFKEMLWKGQVLYGMMMFDEFRAVDYLASRPEVDAKRIGTLGMSMGATKAWWLAALDPRVKVCMDVCCLTDYEELIKAHGLQGHGIYYYVPSLLKHFQTAEINELIVPRAHLSVNGRRDELTPAAGVEKVREYLRPLYAKYGKEEDLRVELFDCEHVELPEMRKLIVGWMDRI